MQRLARDPAGFVARQIDAHCSDVFRRAEASGGDTASDTGGGIGFAPAAHESECDRIGCYSVRGVFEREVTHKRDATAFACSVSGDSEA